MPVVSCRLFALLAAAAALGTSATAQPSAAESAALAQLPDFSGVWVPDVADQRRKERNERPPWTPAAQQQIDAPFADDRAGLEATLADGTVMTYSTELPTE